MSKILVVDDNALNLQLACITLELAGYETVGASDGRNAIEIAESEPLDLILMDLRMPVMDGKQAMRHIKANELTRHIPVVALTASAMKGERELLLASGFDGYIDKPIDVKSFAHTVAGFLVNG
ncbi:MAG: response regulator [Ferrovum sp.]|jgi:CheY-like chemotaxis protein|uniref:response regulator n=1 Tax=Ferrovum sp. TaxID=2609467 RepID=UPI00262BB05E|nr:response regulator [Ferrovum sp.]MBW8067348.1 response regulator [Ferrovum sp.]